MKQAQKQSGFTLIELMITLGVAALLLGLATPSLTAFVVRNQISGTTNELISTINSAKSEAVSRNMCVTVCQSDSPKAAAPVCNGSSDWSKGWVSFVDLNCVGTGAGTGINEITGVRDATPKGYYVSSSNVGRITFNARGQAFYNGTLGGSLAITADNDAGGLSGRLICLDSMGRARILSQKTDVC
jgi:type IV fimbrial biogenesis protein FimT